MEFHQESQSGWEANAAYWDASIGQEGNKYWKLLQRPALERLIPRHRPGSKVLELATGNGLVARWLASIEGGGFASVLATDGSAEMLKHAERRQTDQEAAAKTLYRQVDVTDAAAFDELLKSEPEGFDVVLLNMAIMDIADLNPLAKALPKLLKADGVFVATMLHPVFFTSNFSRSIELKDGNDPNKPEITRAKVIREYLDVPPSHTVAEWGQPTLQVMFHRPIHEIFTTFFRQGLVMDAIEEPAFKEADGVKDRIEAHSNYTQLPALLAFRLRRSS
ncbi:S-adenosyl-L-methionine-dependent methyltransferase [Apiospora arundinis]|uniref:S-adenosyl-L-methionine-dependent methyltransferase n=1 Tax=Apiospora arundinis TaxID=335852 RepID=A0ABR2IGB1_9PEZI